MTPTFQNLVSVVVKIMLMIPVDVAIQTSQILIVVHVQLIVPNLRISVIASILLVAPINSSV